MNRTTRIQVSVTGMFTVMLLAPAPIVRGNCGNSTFPSTPSGMVCAEVECPTGNARREKICFKWENDQDQPVEGLDFEVTTDCSVQTDCEEAIASEVLLKTADKDWVVVAIAEDGSEPDKSGNIGVLKADIDVAGNWSVKIKHPSYNWGANNIDDIQLIPKSTSDYSSVVEGSDIYGYLGNMTLREDSSGGGGIVNMVVGGEEGISGTVNVAKVERLKVPFGGIQTGGSITIGELIADADPNAIELDINASGSASRLLGSITITDMVGKADIKVTSTGAAGPTTASTAISVTNVKGAGFRSIKITGASYTGAITIGSIVDATSKLRVTDGSGDLPWVVNVTNDNNGTFTVGRDIVSGGKIDVGGDSNNIKVFRDLIGTIAVTGDVTGDVDILGDCDGLIDINGNMDGTILVGGSFKANANIVVDGICNGFISIDEDTVNGSLIKLAGLGANGGVTVNADRGNFNAAGKILVDDPASANVTFDGTVRITKDCTVGGNGGDLTSTGVIEVIGCHATGADLDICIEGDEDGTVTITQPGCTNQPIRSCWRSTFCWP